MYSVDYGRIVPCQHLADVLVPVDVVGEGDFLGVVSSSVVGFLENPIFDSSSVTDDRPHLEVQQHPDSNHHTDGETEVQRGKDELSQSLMLSLRWLKRR